MASSSPSGPARVTYAGRGELSLSLSGGGEIRRPNEQKKQRKSVDQLYITLLFFVVIHITFPIVLILTGHTDPSGPLPN